MGTTVSKGKDLIFGEFLQKQPIACSPLKQAKQL